MAAINGISKGELCALLGWSRPRLERRLEGDGQFPVLRRGRGNGTGRNAWLFDAQAVQRYLEGSEAAAADVVEVEPEEEPPLRNSEETAGGARHRGEATARQRRESAQAAMLEDKLRHRRGELVERVEMEMVLTSMLAHLGKGLDGMPDMIVKRLGLPEERADSIRALVDDLRVKMVNDLRSLLSFADA